MQQELDSSDACDVPEDAHPSVAGPEDAGDSVPEAPQCHLSASSLSTGTAGEEEHAGWLGSEACGSTSAGQHSSSAFTEGATEGSFYDALVSQPTDSAAADAEFNDLARKLNFFNDPEALRIAASDAAGSGELNSPTFSNSTVAPATPSNTTNFEVCGGWAGIAAYTAASSVECSGSPVAAGAAEPSIVHSLGFDSPPTAATTHAEATENEGSLFFFDNPAAVAKAAAEAAGSGDLSLPSFSDEPPKGLNFIKSVPHF